jgi:hypothetical protein
MSAGGDLNPCWPALELALTANPGPILDAIAELCGVRWERVAPDPAETLQEILKTAASVQAQLDAIAERLGPLAELLKPRIRKVEHGIVPARRVEIAGRKFAQGEGNS